MKFKKVILTIMVLSVFASACNDDSGGTDQPEPSGMSGTVNGQTWTASTISAYYINSIILITGVAVDGSTVTIRLKATSGYEVREYQLFYNSSSDVVTYQTTVGGNAFATNQFDGSNPTPGTVKITKFDKGSKKLSGTCVTSVKRTSDNQTRDLNIKFDNVTYKTELGETPNKKMTCKVDGVNWSASTVNAIKTGFTNSITIVGNAANQTTVSVTVPDDVEPGTFTIGTLPGISDFLCQYNPTPSTFMKGYPGSVTVTEHDLLTQVLKGTFSFTATSASDTLEITSGIFETSY